MKEIWVVSWKLPPREMSCRHFAKFSPSENNHVYSSTKISYNLIQFRINMYSTKYADRVLR